ncbi:hypothetical protein HDG41_000176 [Paraburkholderia sp. JPY162]|uniref:Uncharacterized protein n=1 Tax=Paraburkholderia youngii TaxID=2782701 RepID=A0A7W8L0W8_9BURK|nr:hypothetical protein [Paraburkholderia youngii]
MSSRVAAPTRCRIGEARVRGPSNPLTVNVVQFRCVCQPAVALCGSRRFERKFTVGTGPLAVGAANRKRRYSHWHSGKPGKRQRGVLEQKRNAIRILESVARQIGLRRRQPLCCCPHCLRARTSRPVGPTRCRPAEPERFGGLSVPTREISLTLSSKVQRWNHGNCAAGCCTNSGFGHAWTRARLYSRSLNAALYVGPSALLVASPTIDQIEAELRPHLPDRTAQTSSGNAHSAFTGRSQRRRLKSRSSPSCNAEIPGCARVTAT